MLVRNLIPLLTLAACSAPQQAVEITFEPRFGEQPISCSSSVADISMTDLRFYVHDLRLLAHDGSEIAVTMVEDPLWQGKEVALLDFEDGTGSCFNGTLQTNTAVRGRVPQGEYSGLKFRIGVPERLNHADPLRAAPPLGYSVMHWHWRTGYKFLRAGIVNETDGFWLHLGSSRCEGTSGSIGGCRGSNRPVVELASFVPGEDVVEVDLRQLTQEIDLGDGTPTDCSSGPAEAECDMPFRALGLDFATGEAVTGAAVFRTGRR